jgi:hypothetical protein
MRWSWLYSVLHGRGPKATIVNIVRTNGTNDVIVTVASPSYAAGFYGDGSPNCTAANVIPLYDVYVQQTARDAFRTRLPTPVRGCFSLRLATSVTVHAARDRQPTNTDIYLAVSPPSTATSPPARPQPVPPRVGLRSTRLQAGPILADPPRRRTFPEPRVEAPSALDQQ